VLIWGGYLQGIFPAIDGAAYNPCTDSWRPLPPFPLEGRRQPLTLWTGSEAILWGGTNRNNAAWRDCAAFDPTTNQWRLLPPVDIFGFLTPSGGWTGSDMLVWGWSNLRSGRARDNQTIAYNPTTNTWRHLAPAPLVPNALETEGTGLGATAVWTADELLVWTASLDAEGPLVLSLDPHRDQWNRLPRALESGTSVQSSPAIWTGAELFLPGAGPDRRSLLLRVRQRPSSIPPRMTG
jgi:hypothetical protein